MAKLYFRHGPMYSAKTLGLISICSNYELTNRKAVIIVPSVDSRYGAGYVKSRGAHIGRSADIVLGPEEMPTMDLISRSVKRQFSAVLVDEAQFLTPLQVNELRNLVDNSQIPVICFGLRTDFQTKLFPGSQRLLELADSIEELKTLCSDCNSKAIFNFRHQSKKEGQLTQPIWEGSQLSLEGDSSYTPLCSRCYRRYLVSSGYNWFNLPPSFS